MLSRQTTLENFGRIRRRPSSVHQFNKPSSDGLSAPTTGKSLSKWIEDDDLHEECDVLEKSSDSKSPNSEKVVRKPLKGQQDIRRYFAVGRRVVPGKNEYVEDDGTMEAESEKATSTSDVVVGEGEVQRQRSATPPREMQSPLPLTPDRLSTPRKPQFYNSPASMSPSPARRVLFDPENSIPERPHVIRKKQPLLSRLRDFQKMSEAVITKRRETGETSSPVKTSKFRKPSPPPSTLLVPFHFRVLLESFRCTDLVMQMLTNRGEKVSYAKLKQNVELTTRRNYTSSSLRQILTVFPEAFKVFSEGSSDEDIIIELPTEDPKLPPPRGLSDRLAYFQSLLIDRLHELHEAFLAKLRPPIVIERCKVRRWHPDFPVDEVPEIKVSESTLGLRTPRTKSCRTARELLKETSPACRARNLFQDSQRTEPEGRKRKLSEDETDSSELKKELRGIKTNLLTKIRTRENLEKKFAMEGGGDSIQDNAASDHLARLCSTVRNIFLLEKKSVLPVKFVHSKLQESLSKEHNPVSLTFCEEQIRLLCEPQTSASILYSVHLRSEEYYKLRKTM